jgi:hypothetical protein
MQIDVQFGTRKVMDFFLQIWICDSLTHYRQLLNYHSGIYFLGKEGLELYSAVNQSSIAEDA